MSCAPVGLSVHASEYPPVEQVMANMDLPVDGIECHSYGCSKFFVRTSLSTSVKLAKIKEIAGVVRNIMYIQ